MLRSKVCLSASIMRLDKAVIMNELARQEKNVWFLQKKWPVGERATRIYYLRGVTQMCAGPFPPAYCPGYCLPKTRFNGPIRLRSTRRFANQKVPA